MVGWGCMTVTILGGSADVSWQSRTVTTGMKDAAWNVHHRAKRTAIPPIFGDALKLLESDVLCLTEFVDEGEGRDEPRKKLAEAGYGHVCATARISGHNKAVFVSRLATDVGDMAAPAVDSHATSNFLHVQDA